MSRVWEHAQASGGALLVLLALADHADDDGYAWPNREALAQKARITSRQVTSILSALADQGEVAYLPGSGRGRPSLYVVLSGLPPDERTQRTSTLPAKAAEILIHLEAGRAIIKQRRAREAERVKKLPPFDTKGGSSVPPLKGEESSTFSSERVKNLPPFDTKGGSFQHQKVEVPIAESGVSDTDRPWNHHVIHGGGRSTTTEADSSTDAAGGGGGGEAWYEESYRLLRSAQVFEANARKHAAHPPERVRRIIAEGQARADVVSLGGWITNALNLIDPYAPEVPHETVSTRSRAAARRAERPAGSGPPPGVRTPTTADLVAWGLADPTDGDEPPDVPEVRT